MQLDRTAILLIGSGRMARHLQHWNSLLQSPNHLLTWNRHQDLSLLQSHAAKSTLVWLAISDAAIVSFYEQHLAALKKKVVHFSGALNDSRLLCAHPLMSFPTALLENSVYSQIHFAVTGAEKLQTALPGFQNSFSILLPEHKSLYHALCVVSGNFPQLLWSETFPQFQNLQIPEEAFATYIRQITENFIQHKQQALTGPLVRNDQQTIQKNQIALEKSKLQKIYQAFSQEFVK